MPLFTPDAATLQQYPLLTAMLTPALFLTASGALLTNANNRLARISDRLREHLSTIAALPTRSATSEGRLDVMRRRAALALSAIQRLHFAIAMFVLTSLTIAVEALAGLRLPQLPTGLAMLGVLVMLSATVALWREARLAVQSLELMIAGAQEHARDREAAREAVVKDKPPG